MIESKPSLTAFTLSSALKALAAPSEDLPERALRWTLDHWDIARPALLQSLARMTRDPDGASDADAIVSYFAVHLFAQKREAGAAVQLRALLRTPGEAAAMFGDDSGAIATVLISTFDGDGAALRALAEDERNDPVLRNAALQAVGYLTSAGAIDRDETHRWFGAMFGLLESGQVDLFVDWSFAVASCGFADLLEPFYALLPQDLNDPDAVSMDELASDLRHRCALAREESDPLAVYADGYVGLVDDAIVSLRRVDERLRAAAERAEEERQDEDDAPLAPVVNPIRGIGRNDPCPCGSGKKFKKCCLATQAEGS